MDLDSLKNTWKQIPKEEEYSKEAILEIIKKKSSSIIRSLFLFTLVEGILILIYSLITLFNGKLIIGNIKKIEGSAIHNYLTSSSIVLIITICFLIYTYKKFKKIRLNTSVSTLIQQIINYRKTVNLFISVIALVLIILSIPFYYQLGRTLYIDKIGTAFLETEAHKFGILSVIISILFIILITCFYYLIIYLIFLRRLSRNLKELKSIN